MTSYYNQNNEGKRFGNDRFGEKRDRDEEKPTYNRLFIVCGKTHTADDLREGFAEYGSIEDVYVLKDKTTGENRGIAYIQYAKMSEACLAIESLNGKKLPGDESGSKLKVIMARSRNTTNSNIDPEEESALARLFVLIPKGMEESELRDSFAEFGEIDFVQVVKDRNTGEKKGFGYITFRRAYEAAKALEECDRSFKAVIAEPKASRVKRDAPGGNENGGRGNIMVDASPYSGGGFSAGGFQLGRGGDVTMDKNISSVFDGLNGSSGTIGNRLQVICSTSINNDQLARLFDLIPGMELCDLKKNFSTGESKGIAIVVYNSVGSATYAREKLNGFEYPPGYPLSVRYAADGQDDVSPTGTRLDVGMSFGGSLANQTPIGGASYCNVDLPPAQPLVKTEEVAERLFIVCQPSPPPPNVLVDVFSRFGDLIDVYTLKNKNFGYAKFASCDAAAAAMEKLHGVEVLGSKLKVLKAEPPKDDSESGRKRPRT